MSAVTKQDVEQSIEAAVSKLATKDELAEAVSKLATKAELAAVRDELLDQIHLNRILAEDTNRTVQLMYELLLPKTEKVDQIDPLERRIETCEEQIDVLNVAVKSHVTDHPQKP